jgi:hypothetical protein
MELSDIDDGKITAFLALPKLPQSLNYLIALFERKSTINLTPVPVPFLPR